MPASAKLFLYSDLLSRLCKKIHICEHCSFSFDSTHSVLERSSRKGRCFKSRGAPLFCSLDPQPRPMYVEPLRTLAHRVTLHPEGDITDTPAPGVGVKVGGACIDQGLLSQTGGGRGRGGGGRAMEWSPASTWTKQIHLSQ